MPEDDPLGLFVEEDHGDQGRAPDDGDDPLGLFKKAQPVAQGTAPAGDDPLGLFKAPAAPEPVVRPELRAQPVVWPPESHPRVASVPAPAAVPSDVTSTPPVEPAITQIKTKAVYTPAPDLLADLVQHVPHELGSAGPPVAEAPPPAPPSPPAFDPNAEGARANLRMGRESVPGSVEDVLVQHLHEAMKPTPEDLAPTSRLGKAAFMAGRMASDPKLLGLAAASMVIGPEVWALTAIPGAWKLGTYAGQQVMKEREHLAGREEPDFGHDAVSHTDAAFALGQVIAAQGLPAALPYLDRVLGRGMAQGVQEAMAAGESTTPALMRAYAMRLGAHAAAGAGAGVAFSQDDPVSGAIIGAVFGGMSAARELPSVSVPRGAPGVVDETVPRLPARGGATARVAGEPAPSAGGPDFTVEDLTPAERATAAAAPPAPKQPSASTTVEMVDRPEAIAREAELSAQRAGNVTVPGAGNAEVQTSGAEPEVNAGVGAATAIPSGPTPPPFDVLREQEGQALAKAQAERRKSETIQEDGETRFATARTPAGSRRPVAKVATDALLDEYLEIMDKMQDASQRSQYRRADSDGASDTFFSKVTVADRQGGGPSKQAKALKNLDDYERIQGELDTELRRRGLSDEDIGDRLMAREEQRSEREAIMEHGMVPPSGPSRRQPRPPVDRSAPAHEGPRRRFPIPRRAPLITSKPFDESYKGHADYAKAKAGDVDAAARFVQAQVDPATVERARAEFGDDVTYVAPVAAERTGDNAIPQQLAEYYAASTGARTDTEIVQANQAGHTGADLMERLVAPVQFDGPVEQGKKYVLVDDVVTSGGTLGALADHIRRGGGQVVGSVTLASGSRSGELAPRPQIVRELERRFGDDIRSLFHTEPDALTRDEADYLIGFRSAAELRTRAAAASEARAQRGRREGVRAPAPGTAPRAGGTGHGAGAADSAEETGREVEETEGPEDAGPVEHEFRSPDEPASTARTAPKVAPSTPTPAVVAPGGMAKVAEGLVKAKNELTQIFTPASATPQSEAASYVIREHAGDLALRNERAREQMKGFSRQFLRMPEADRLEFIDRVETGREQRTPALTAAATLMRDWLDSTRDAIRALGTGKLEQYIENYFPHIWADPDQAKKVIGTITGKRPLEGPKSFLKKRSIPTTKEGIAAGLTPVTTNPVDLTLLKLREMNKYLMAQKIMAELKATGLAQFVPAMEKPPAEHTRIDDKVAMVYGPPDVQIHEAFDGLVRKGLTDAIARLNAIAPLRHERAAKIGGKRLGYAMSSGDFLATKFGSIDGVLMHELGHILDDRYGLWDKLTDTRREKGGGEEKGRSIAQELRALADLRYEGQEASPSYQKYVRKQPEKMANAVHALLYAPEKMAEVAPTVKRRLENFLKSKPELAPILEIKPSLVIDTATSSVPVGGLVVKGQYWAPEAVARLLNNHLAPGLRGRSAIYDGYMGLGNTLNQAQLALSAFHLGFTSLDAATSQVALGIKELGTAASGATADVTPGARGRLAGSAVGRVLTYPLAPVSTMVRGDRLLKAYLTGRTGSSAELAQMVSAIVRAGGRVRMDTFYKNGSIDSFVKSITERRGVDRAIGMIAHAFPAALELTAKPIMEYVVPRQKLGVFAAMAEYELKRLGPNAKPAAVRRALAKAWDSVDNRLGQLVYDNLFWHKLLKDWSMASVRAVGWNLGTIREVGGGMKDIVAEGVKASKGEEAEFTHRASYIPALLLVAMTAGAVTQYLFTGKGPEEIKDFFYPKTGRKNKEGNDERVQLPTYLKDVVAWGKHPLTTLSHKLHPMIGSIAEMLLNEDFYGDKIRNPDDKLVKQVAQFGEYLLQQYTSLSLRNASDEKKRGQGTAEKAAGFVGVTAAPREEVRTPAQNKMAEYLTSRGHRSRTPEEKDAGELRMDVVTGLRDKTTTRSQVRAMVRAGELTAGQATHALVAAREDPLLVKFKQLDYDEAKTVYALADARERALWADSMKRKQRIAGRLERRKAAAPSMPPSP